jgi:hypothetical protein
MSASRILLPAVVLALMAQPLSAQVKVQPRVQSTSAPASASASQPAGPPTSIELRLSPLADLVLYVHTLAERQVVDAPSNLASAMSAARAISVATDNDPVVWGAIEGWLGACETAAELRQAMSELPEPYPIKRTPGRSVNLREPAVAWAAALEKAEPWFQRELWPARKKTLLDQKATLAAILGPMEAECLKAIFADFQMIDPHVVVPVYLVLDAPEPGAMTYRGPDKKAACYVGLSGAPSALWSEIVLHESIHAIETAVRGQSATKMLRQRLTMARVPAMTIREVQHALIFVEAGEVVRRYINGRHLHFGDAQGTYALMSEEAQYVREPWTEYLDGKLTLDETLKRIVHKCQPLLPPLPAPAPASAPASDN